MSKYKEITTQITDPDHITAALTDLGVAYEVARPGQTLALNGWSGRGQRAEIVVRKVTLDEASGRGYAYADLGWAMDPQTGAYRLVLDDYDERNRGVMNIVEGVTQRSAFYRLAELVAQNGFTLETASEFDVQRVFIGR
ncbi:MAG: hypothetical protein FOGNACKC_06033 [Anaerolineae bacterium]|nr:hypothetical protein [Anaerolineae bacterium]